MCYKGSKGRKEGERGEGEAAAGLKVGTGN